MLNPHYGSGNKETDLRSLRLPTARSDMVAFASPCALLSLHYEARTLHEAFLQGKTDGERRRGTPQPKPKRAASFSPPPACETPPSRRPSVPTREAEAVHEDAGTEREGTRYDNLFLRSLLESKPNGLVTVMTTQEVLFYSLEDRSGPRPLPPRLKPLPGITPQQRRHKDKSVKGGVVQPSVTSFSIVPLHIALAVQPVPSRHTATDAPPSTMAEERDAVEFAGSVLRGVVGCSDGRVSVFSETRYVFSFAAHHSPVTAAYAIHLTENRSSGQDGSLASGGNQGHTEKDDAAPEDVEGELACSLRDGDIVVEAHAGNALSRNSSRSALPAPPEWEDGSSRTSAAHRHRHPSFTSLGFVTSGLDGAVYVWRKNQRVFQPHRALPEKQFFTRCSAFHLYYPPPAAGLASRPAETPFDPLFPTRTNGALLLQTLSPTAVLLHATTETLTVWPVRHHWGTKELQQVEGVLSTASRGHRTLGCTTYELPTARTNWRRYDVTTLLTNEGGTTAVRSNQSFTLLARDYELFRVNHIRDTTPICILVTPYAITDMALGDHLAVLGAMAEGVVMLVRPTAPAALLLCEYGAIRQRPLRQVALHEGVALMTLVDAEGNVELVSLPPLYSPAVLGKGKLEVWDALPHELPSVWMLQTRCALDDALARQQHSRQVRQEETAVIHSFRFAAALERSAEEVDGDIPSPSTRGKAKVPKPLREVFAKLLGRRRHQRGATTHSLMLSSAVSSGASPPRYWDTTTRRTTVQRCREALRLARLAVNAATLALRTAKPGVGNTETTAATTIEMEAAEPNEVEARAPPLDQSKTPREASLRSEKSPETRRGRNSVRCATPVETPLRLDATQEVLSSSPAPHAV